MRPGEAAHPGVTSDETLWSVLAHCSFFMIGLIGPIIIMLTKGTESRYVRHHAVEALTSTSPC